MPCLCYEIFILSCVKRIINITVPDARLCKRARAYKTFLNLNTIRTGTAERSEQNGPPTKPFGCDGRPADHQWRRDNNNNNNNDDDDDNNSNGNRNSNNNNITDPQTVATTSGGGWGGEDKRSTSMLCTRRLESL
uniref:Uncharacterized protein n=1 Tax=Sipha flava TaxID=143950 RepID=A0A2S2QBY5_9HEMI